MPARSLVSLAPRPSRTPPPSPPIPAPPSGSTFTCQVNPTDFSPVSLDLLKYLPTISCTDGTYQFCRPVKQHLIEYTGKFDQTLSGRDRLTLRYFYDRFDNTGVLNTANLLSYSDGATIRYHSALISEAHTFSATLLNNFSLSYQIENASRGPLAGAPNVASLGVKIYQPAFSQIQVANAFTVGDNPSASFRRNNYTLSDDLHWVRGSHTFGFGFHGELAKVDVNNLFQQPGVFQFRSNATVSSDLADFLLGGLVTFSRPPDSSSTTVITLPATTRRIAGSLIAA